MIYTLVIPNQIPLSQNRRNKRITPGGQSHMDNYRQKLIPIFNAKYPGRMALNELLYAKVFWIHKIGDAYFHSRDADNFSKPLWDAFNKIIYNDDEQIRFRQAAKLQHGDNQSLTVNVSDMNAGDYNSLLYFHLDPTNIEQNWLYIEIGEFKHSHVKFGEI